MMTRDQIEAAIRGGARTNGEIADAIGVRARGLGVNSAMDYLVHVGAVIPAPGLDKRGRSVTVYRLPEPCPYNAVPLNQIERQARVWRMRQWVPRTAPWGVGEIEQAAILKQTADGFRTVRSAAQLLDCTLDDVQEAIWGEIRL